MNSKLGSANIVACSEREDGERWPEKIENCRADRLHTRIFAAPPVQMALHTHPIQDDSDECGSEKERLVVAMCEYFPFFLFIVAKMSRYLPGRIMTEVDRHAQWQRAIVHGPCYLARRARTRHPFISIDASGVRIVLCR